MNKNIEEYTKEVLEDFYYFLFLYSGQLLGNWVTDVKIYPFYDGEPCDKLSDGEITELIRIFIESRKHL